MKKSVRGKEKLRNKLRNGVKKQKLINVFH